MTTTEKVPSWKWAVVWAMFLATMLNYMDRQTMASTKSYIQADFKLNEEGYGWIEYWFGISFAIMQLLAGVLADRVNLRWLYAGAVLLWSIAGFMTGVVGSFNALCVCRFILGIGESFNWICATGVVQRLIPRESRSLANGIYHGGASVGAAITPLIAALMLVEGGKNWRDLFLVVGAAGIIWVVLWFVLLRGTRAAEVSHSSSHAAPAAKPDALPEKSFFHVFKLRKFWITMGFGIGVNVAWHVYRLWLPGLLEKEWKLFDNKFQFTLAGFFIAADLGCLAAGWATRKLIERGLTIEQARFRMMLITSALCLIAAPAVYTRDLRLAIPLLFITAAGAMGGFASFYSMVQDISGPHTSRCLGVIGAVIWLIIARIQPFIGQLVDRFGTFLPIFAIVGFLPLITALLALFWPKPEALAEK